MALFINYHACSVIGALALHCTGLAWGFACGLATLSINLCPFVLRHNVLIVYSSYRSVVQWLVTQLTYEPCGHDTCRAYAFCSTALSMVTTQLWSGTRSCVVSAGTGEMPGQTLLFPMAFVDLRGRPQYLGLRIWRISIGWTVYTVRTHPLHSHAS